MDLVTLGLAKKYTEKQIEKAALGDIQLDEALKEKGRAADAQATGEAIAKVREDTKQDLSAFGEKVVGIEKQTFTEAQKNRARLNIGINGQGGFVYNFTTYDVKDENNTMYRRPADAAALDFITRNWNKEAMSIYVQGYPVIGVDVDRRQLKVLYKDKYITTFSWSVSNSLQMCSLYLVSQHQLIDKTYGDGNYVMLGSQTLTENQKAQVKTNIGLSNYVIDSGSVNKWNYRKWSNGDSECWMTVSADVAANEWSDSGLISLDSGLGVLNPLGGFGIYWTKDRKIQFAYPDNLFVSAPTETAFLAHNCATFNKDGTGGNRPPLFLMAVKANSLNTTNFYRICSYKDPGKPMDVTLTIRADGKWK